MNEGSPFLSLDAGNTSVNGGFFYGRRLAGGFRLASDAARGPDEYGVLLRQVLTYAGVDAPTPLPSVLCSVVPALTSSLAAALEKYFGVAPYVVGPDYGPLGIEVCYENVAEVGADRVVNALAVRELYGAPAVVVDFGTATTFDVVAANGAYVGGVIAPGVELSAGTLVAKAARLSAVAFTMPPRVVGRNTDEAVRAGILLGAARAADGIVAAIREERRESGVLVATGGLAGVVAPLMTTTPMVDADLTLKGLALVFQKISA